jgi:hypothetical protein
VNYYDNPCWWITQKRQHQHAGGEKEEQQGANVTKTEGQVGRDHNSETAGRYNTNTEDTNIRSRQVDDA